MHNINFVGQPTPTPDDCAGQIRPTDTCGSSADSTLHNSLNGLQGGTVSERYHLTKQQHDNLSTSLSGLMDLTTNQTANGIKTFLQSPQVPFAVNANDAVPFSQLNGIVGVANNGLGVASGHVQLGGPLIHNTQVTTTGFSLNIGSLSTETFTAYSDYAISSNTGVDGDGSHHGNVSQILSSDSEGATSTWLALYSTGTGNTIHTSIRISDSSIAITDTNNSLGMYYTADYSSAGTTNNRWIPDWGAVTSAYTFSNGLTNTTGTVRLGGTLTQNTTIDLNTHTLAFSADIKVHGLALGTGNANSNSSNTAFGNGTLATANSVSGSIQNTAIGQFALQGNTTGTGNTAVGAQTLPANATGSNNTVLGNFGLTFSTSGSDNTSIGAGALEQLRTGSQNTALGSGAGGNANTTGSGNVFVGYNAGYSETGSGRLYIANSNTGTPLIFGNFGTPALTINGTLTSTGLLTTPAATSGAASLRITAGTNYTGSTDGSIWQDGNHLYAYINGAPRQLDQQTGGGTGVASISIASANGVTGVSSGGSTPTLTFTLRTSVREVPSGLLNGSNTSFTLANSPLTGQEMLFINGILANSGDDYNITGANITMLSAPISTDKILATYPY